jgi:hypothetical protein
VTDSRFRFREEGRGAMRRQEERRRKQRGGDKKRGEEDRALTASKDSLRATRLAGFFGIAAFVKTEVGRKGR